MKTEILVDNHVVIVERHALSGTGFGIAGFFAAALPDGRSVLALGRWDRSDLLEHDKPWCAELVWIDGELVENDEEGSLFLWLVPGDEGIHAESVALALYKHTTDGGSTQ